MICKSICPTDDTGVDNVLTLKTLLVLPFLVLYFNIVIRKLFGYWNYFNAQYTVKIIRNYFLLMPFCFKNITHCKGV